MKFKNQVNLVYDGRTQQKGRAANDDQEGAQESSLGGEEDLPNPGIKPESLVTPALVGRFFTTSGTWEAHLNPSSTHDHTDFP